MLGFRSSAVLIVLTFCPPGLAVSQETVFDPGAFEAGLNNFLETRPGISVTDAERLLADADPDRLLAAAEAMINSGDAELMSQARAALVETYIARVPEYGWLVEAADGTPLELFPPSVPTSEVDGSFRILGLDLNDGTSVRAIGPSEWAEVAGTLVAEFEQAAVDNVSGVSEDIVRVINLIDSASAYVVDQLCDNPARPSELTLSVTAGFKLAFNVETGSEVKWDLVEVCARE